MSLENVNLFAKAPKVWSSSVEKLRKESAMSADVPRLETCTCVCRVSTGKLLLSVKLLHAEAMRESRSVTKPAQY